MGTPSRSKAFCCSGVGTVRRERRLGGDRLGLAAVGEAGLGDRDREVLGHLEAAEHAAHAQADLILTAQGALLASRGGGHLLDLPQRALLAVARVADRGQRAGATLEVARADVVEHERAVVQRLSRQGLLDLRLALAEPVHGGIEVLGRDLLEAQQLAERGGGARGIQGASRGELGVGREHACHDQRHGAVALGAAARREHPEQSHGRERAGTTGR
jgi:hypothetical protein